MAEFAFFTIFARSLSKLNAIVWYEVRFVRERLLPRDNLGSGCMAEHAPVSTRALALGELEAHLLPRGIHLLMSPEVKAFGRCSLVLQLLLLPRLAFLEVKVNFARV